MDDINELSFKIRGAIFEVHGHLGPGLLETVYEAALMNELQSRGLYSKSQIGVPVMYKGINLEMGFRLDILVEDQIIIEVKSVEMIHDVHKKQLLTYLKLSDKKLGLLVNFNSARLKDKESIIRIING
jgi:GxxExxY protein